MRVSPETDNNFVITRASSTRAYACASAQLPECRSDMAAPAVLPETAVMHIFSIMTVNTASTRRIHLLSGTRVTGHARNFPVCAVKLKTRFVVMIKVPDTPVARVVADTTDRAQLSLVRVVLAVAAHARAGCVLESRSLVTILAYDFHVTAEEREARFRMIKARRFPALLAMTVFATRALLAGVNIILAMA